MASRLNKETDKSGKLANEGYNSTPLIVVACVLAIIGLIFFAAHRFYSFARPIDGALWGEFGDFIGGVVGTVIAYISIRLLVATLNTQTQSNVIATDAYQRNGRATTLQLLNDQFKMLIELYEKALNSIKDKELSGPQYLKRIKGKMFEEFDSEQLSFAERKEKAVALFENFYRDYRNTASVYFRIIFRLLKIIFNQDLEPTDKVPFAKMLRCQFSEEELFFIRYNAMTSNGKNLRIFLNQYNIQKHLPELSLLEFKFWYNFIDQVHHSEVITYLISLRKSLLHGDKQNSFSGLPSIGGRFEIGANMDKDRSKFVLTIRRDMSKPIDTIGLPSAFEKFSKENLRDFFDDILHEIVLYYNFELNQKESDVVFDKSATTIDCFEVIETVVTTTDPSKELHLYIDNDPA